MAAKFGRIAHLKRDRKLEGVTGVDIKIDEQTFLSVLAATDANAKWRDKAPKVVREIKRLENAGASREDLHARMCALYAETLVTGWRGVVDEHGKPVTFTVENCTAYLAEADDAFSAIERECYDTQNFRTARAEAIVDEVKKS